MARLRDVQTVHIIVGVRLIQIAHEPLYPLHLAKHCLIAFANRNFCC